MTKKTYEMNHETGELKKVEHLSWKEVAVIFIILALCIWVVAGFIALFMEGL